MNMKKRSWILIITSVLFLAFLCVGTLVTPEVGFSENENRYLQAAPKLTVDHVLNGRFETQAEDYLNDQIIGRRLWVRTMAMTEAALGVGDINGVYLAADGRVVKRVTEADFDWDRYRKNLKQVAELAESREASGGRLYAMLVPTAAYVYQNDLPSHAMRFDEDRAFADAADALGDRLIDLRAAMQAAVRDGSAARESADGGVFFRTDHHWSGYGAYLGYAEFLQARAGVSLSDDTSRRAADGKAAQIAGSESAGQEARNVNGSFAAKAAPSYAELAPTVLSDDFYGTLYSKVLLTTLTKDSVETPGAALTAKYQVRLNGETYDSLYFNEYLHKKDKYAVYFGGNYDKVDIEIGETTGQAAQTASSKGSLLILKDSFANSFVPYLLGDYSRITMIDSRYYRGSVTELAEDYDEVLILYGIDNFAGEKLHLSKSLIK